MKINVNNGMYLKVSIDKTRNAIKIEKYEKRQVILTRYINESEFVDLYNLLSYAQDNKKFISSLWGL